MLPSLVAHSLLADQRPLVTRLSADLTAQEDAANNGLFLSARATASHSRLVFSLGHVPDLVRYTVCHRYEPYWMKAQAGTRLTDVPAETQFLLAELTYGLWLLLVPLVDDLFRFSLRGTREGALELLAETGDAFSAGMGGLALYVAAGSDPYALLQDGARSVMQRLCTGRLRRDKPLPDFVDMLGWCTWDAFYQEVSAEKLEQGLKTFAAGGVSPRFLILDDGWQSAELSQTGERRLTAFSANQKFGGDLRPCIALAKENFGIQRFLVWHSMVGYWGGVDGERLTDYGVIDQTRQFGEGVLRHEPAFNQMWWGNRVGFVPTANIARFFDDYHRTLRAQGVDGVKVDSQAVLEGLAQGQGGRVAVTRAYRAALEASVQRHFGGQLINCMSNAQETFYGSPDSTLLRTSMDFLPSRPESHGSHLYANAQVGLWFGQFMHPDWDMFQSGHVWGEYHAAGRVVSGGPIYVSDKPGEHDFKVLRALTCSDGSVLRPDGPGLPTLDVLCRDPTREPILFKVWNRCGAAGLVGAFHAQSGGDAQNSPILYGTVGPMDVPELEGQEFASYAYRSQRLERFERQKRREVSLGQREFELFTFVPIVDGFAAIGLVEKMNSARSITTQRVHTDRLELDLRDGGTFLAFSTRAPSRVEVGGSAVAFGYSLLEQALRVPLAKPGPQTLTITW